MTDIDPAAVMAEHERHVPGCSSRLYRTPQHMRCEPYRLAKALATEQAKVTRVRIEVERLEARFPSADQVGHEVARWFRTALADEPEQAS